MKNRFGNLVKNESIKVFSKTGYKVVFIITLSLAIIIPLLIFGAIRVVKGLVSYADSTEQRYEDALSEAETDRHFEDKVDEETWLARNDAMMDTMKFFIDNDIDDTWKQEYFYNSIYSKHLTVSALKLIVDGKLTYDEVVESNLSYYLPTEEDQYGNSSPCGPDADFEKLLKTATDDLNESKDYVVKLKPSEYAKDIVDSLDARLEEAKAQEAYCKSEAESDSKIKYQYEIAKLKVEACTYLSRSARFIMDNNISPDDWRFKKLFSSVIVSICNELPDYAIPVKDFYESPEGKEIFPPMMSYSDYVIRCKQALDSSRDALKEAEYALVNNIRPSGIDDISVKSIFRLSFSAVTGMLSLIIAIMACTIVTSEYSSGAIRLLLPRPRTRFEILNSKYVTILLTSVLSTLAAFILTFLMSIIGGGVGDMFEPDLVWRGGPGHIPSVIYSLENLLMEVLNMMLSATVGFFFAVVTKKSASSITLSILVSYLSSGIATIALMMQMLKPKLASFIKFTIFPYTDLVSLRSTPLSGLISTQGINITVNGVSGNMASGSNVVLGCVIVLIHILFIWSIANIIFKKHEIKN